MKKQTATTVVVLVSLACAFLICVGIGGVVILSARQEARRTRLTELNRAALDLRRNLYVPSGAIALDETSSASVPPYARQCMVAVVEVAYAIDRPYCGVMSDYRDSLSEAGWVERLPYRGHDVVDYVVWARDAQAEVSFSRIEPGEDTWTTVSPAAFDQYPTIYIIRVTYAEPSVAKCFG